MTVRFLGQLHFAVTTPTRALLDMARAKRLQETLIWPTVRGAVDRGMIKPNDEKKIRSTFYDE